MISKLKQAFTLIELVVVIVVIGILAAIVIPNISSFKEDAKEKAIIADTRNIQTAVDFFVLKNEGNTPTKDIPALGDPQIIETYAMRPDYIRNLPKTEGVKFWLDENNTVWGSTVDAPQNVNYEEGQVTWDTVEGAVTYKIYKTSTNVSSSVRSAKKLEYIGKTVSVKGSSQSKELPSLEFGTYLVSAVDQYGFESPSTRVDSSYQGYNLGPQKDLTVSILLKPKPTNNKPKSSILFSQDAGITSLTKLKVTSDSFDEDGDEIVATEWKWNGAPLEQLKETYPLGLNVLEVRVKDEHGLWSDWERREFTVVNPEIYLTYGSEHGIPSVIGHKYNISEYGPMLKIRGVSDMTGVRVKVVAAAYGTSWTLPYTSSTSKDRPQDHNKKEIILTLGKNGSEARFKYTDSFLAVYSAEIVN